MTNHLGDGDIKSESPEFGIKEVDSATLTAPQGPRRRISTPYIVVAALLVVAAATLVVSHIASESKALNSLSSERQLGLSDAAAGRCVEATTLLAPVVAADAVDFAAKEALGKCYEVLAEYNNALPLLRDVASSQPILSNEFSLANAAFSSGDVSLSQSALKAAISNVTSPSDLLSIAETAESYGMYPIAADALRDTQSASRTYIWYEVDAKTQLGLGNPGIAVTAALRAAQLAPQSTRGSILADLGDTYVSAGEYSAAANAYQEALSTHQTIDTTSIYLELVQCYINLGKYPSAIAVAQSGLAIAKGVDQFSFELDEATSLARLNRAREAIQMLKSVIAARSAPANIVASANAMLSTLSG